MSELEKNIELKSGDTPEHLEFRKKMIKGQIIARGVRDSTVLKAMVRVPRHRFVHEGIEGSAHEDAPLPIGENQTISQPFIVAYMTEALQLDGHEKVLEVGTGSGYQAAVLAEIADRVFTIEINQNLAIDVARRFKKMGYDNIFLKFGNGYQGWPEHAPFDGIVVTAAPNEVPEPLIQQLKVGGKMVVPVGATNQDLIVVTKLPDGSIDKDTRIPVRFVPMIREVEQKD